MDDQFENVFEEHNRHRISSHLAWTEALRIAIALPLLFVAFSLHSVNLYNPDISPAGNKSPS
jgi:hypothetical protein